MNAELVIPRIETSRLTLRAHGLADHEACAAMWADPAVTRHIGGKPSTSQQTWMRMLAYRGHWALMNFGYWAVVERATGSYVGELGFADFKRAIEPSMRGVPELGWAFASPSHGKGYATEAVRAALAWSDGRWPDGRTVCVIDESNAPSIRVAAKTGFRQFARDELNGSPVFFFERHAGARGEPARSARYFENANASSTSLPEGANEFT